MLSLQIDSASNHLKGSHLPLHPLQSLLLPSTSCYNCSSAESCVDVLFPFPHSPILFSTHSYLDSTPDMALALKLLLLGCRWAPRYKSIGYFPRFTLLFGSTGLTGCPLLLEASSWLMNRLRLLRAKRKEQQLWELWGLRSQEAPGRAYGSSFHSYTAGPVVSLKSSHHFTSLTEIFRWHSFMLIVNSTLLNALKGGLPWRSSG